jgi:hypothetical protein
MALPVDIVVQEGRQANFPILHVARRDAVGVGRRMGRNRPHQNIRAYIRRGFDSAVKRQVPSPTPHS